eukprot:3616852-Amphidinium_carterae.1
MKFGKTLAVLLLTSGANSSESQVVIDALMIVLQLARLSKAPHHVLASDAHFPFFQRTKKCSARQKQLHRIQLKDFQCRPHLYCTGLNPHKQCKAKSPHPPSFRLSTS